MKKLNLIIVYLLAIHFILGQELYAIDSCFKLKNIQLEMVLVNSGTFIMGSKLCKFPQEPVHPVQISNSFWIGKYEITQKDYEAIMGQNPSAFTSKYDTVYEKNVFLGYTFDSWLRDYSFTPYHPVENVSFIEACRFCNILSYRSGLQMCYKIPGNGTVECDFTKNGFRLPTEAEWEYAARGGSNSEKYSTPQYYKIEEVAWIYTNSDKKSKPVGFKFANDYGIHDMFGSVWEWTYDWFMYTFYYAENKIDPTGPAEGEYKVIRGGSFLEEDKDIYIVAPRKAMKVKQIASNVGFRIVRAA